MSIGKSIYQDTEVYFIDLENIEVISVYKMEGMQLLYEVLSDAYQLKNGFS
ncbi:hypothetical protein PC1101_15500 [Streptococcus pneumoniae]|nr:hypothetical protein PC1101_15500 [Streptococcus pneumoniae]